MVSFSPMQSLDLKWWSHLKLRFRWSQKWKTDTMIFSTDTVLTYIGFTLLYFKVDVMPLVHKTKMADVCIRINLRNLLAKRTTWLVVKTTSATSIFSCVFGAYSMIRIFYEYSHLPTFTLFSTISLGESTQLFFT